MRQLALEIVFRCSSANLKMCRLMIPIKKGEMREKADNTD